MHLTALQALVILIHLVIFCPLVLGMISLFFWQLGISTQNMTTIEASIRRKAKREAKKQGKRYKWPYSFRPARNMVLFYGPNPRSWLLPVIPPTLGDGIHFTMVHGKLQIFCYGSLSLRLL